MALREEEPEQTPALTPDQWVILILLFAGVAISILITVFPLREFAEVGEGFGGIGTFIVSLTAAGAAFWWFRRRASIFPKAIITQDIILALRLENKNLLEVCATIRNVGDIPISLDEWRLWASPIEPMPASLSTMISNGKDAFTDSQIEWPACAGERMRLPDIRIRSGETQQVLGFLVISSEVTVARIYSFFPNSAFNICGQEDRGWTNYTIINLGELRMQVPGPIGTSNLAMNPGSIVLEEYRAPKPVKYPDDEEPYREPVKKQTGDPKPSEKKEEGYRQPKR
ncbi:MAG TPA: hypothetical protein VN999_13305 [Thermoanaerobaculia bacterium]|nr:hypothetical protein [Thermoanaerobaculia bacterium]